MESTDLFTGTATRPLQVIRVTVEGDAADDTGEADQGITSVRAEGPGIRSDGAFGVTGVAPGQSRTIEIGVTASGPAGSTRAVTVIAETGQARAELTGQVTVAEPGWTMWMVSHFHYDPVWWSTQGQFTQARLVLPDEDGSLPDVRTAFELVRLHLEKARRDPDYKFVLAEIDYLKPYFDVYPHERAEFRALIAAGRVELVGGTYNEPNTNLTSAELTIRNAVYGLGHQRDLIGADPRTAWMLDVFGHDPGFPGLMAQAGLTSSSWARGPFHQWGPDENTSMQFPAEFEWLSPDGSGLLTSYMANHYGAGWTVHTAGDAGAAQAAAYEQFRQLAPVAATRNVLLPVGSDHVIPARWVTDVHRSWNEKYVWPRFVTAIPREFFDAVRAEASGPSVSDGLTFSGSTAAAGRGITPQTRDMNPVYTGKDVSYIDTKQANRAAETALAEAERFATLAWLRGAPYPAASLDKAWRQLAYGAHHDALTGTEGDQVYLDLLAGWREAWQRGQSARRDATGFLAGTVPGGGVTVFNGLARERDGLATVTVTLGQPGTARWLTLADGEAEVPALAEGIRRHADGSLASVTLTFRARAVPGLGFRRYGLRPGSVPASGGGWTEVPGTCTIENERVSVTADPDRGGALTAVRDVRTGRNALRGPGNELVLQEEYGQHPRWGEGPWHLSPKGPGTGSAASPATVVAQRSSVGSRLVARFTLGDLAVTQETIVWDGADRVEFRTHVSGSIGQDRLLRIRFPAEVPGGLPVYQTATAVIGRPFGAPEADTAADWWTLDNPANQWFGLGSVAAVTLGGDPGSPGSGLSGAGLSGAGLSGAGLSGAGAGGPVRQAIGVAEVITPDEPNAHGSLLRDLVISLGQAGVTATCSRASGPRYGAVAVDSNLPDFRIAVGGPGENSFTASVLSACDPGTGKRLDASLADNGSARLWVPASRSRAEAFAPGADLRGPRDLPVLIIAATARAGEGAGTSGEAPAGRETGLRATIDALRAELATGTVSAELADDTGTVGADTALAGGTVALFNRGTPSSVVTPDGTLWMSLMRACSSWPSGVWIDGDQRRAPDGSSFAWQHWSHTFAYALAVTDGGWREASLSAGAEDYNHGLVAMVTPGGGAGDGAGDASIPEPAVSAATPSGTTVSEPDISQPHAAVEPLNVSLTALKPRGNPLASGRSPAASGNGASGDEAGRELTIRLREMDGTRTTARVRIPARVEAAWRSSPVEDTTGDPVDVRDGVIVVELGPFENVTLGARVAAGDRPAPATPTPTPTPAMFADSAAPATENANATGDAEPVSAVYSRYWLHGKGAAPAGNLPVTVSFTPTRVTLGTGEPPEPLRLTVAAGPEPVSGQGRLVLPSGLTAGPETTFSYDLEPHAFAAWEVTIGAEPSAAEGRYFVTAVIDAEAGGSGTGTDGRGGAGTGHPGTGHPGTRHTVEDAALVTIGEAGEPDRDLPPEELFFRTIADTQALGAESDLELPDGDILLAPGETGRLRVRVVSHLASELRGELQLISPFGTWEGIPSWDRPVTVAPGGQAEVTFDVTVPPGAGGEGTGWESWLLLKLMYFGRVRYSPAVRLKRR
ncbi:MAG TPA: glycoside hydrolase family 38 C-terminal domain-containing protein [Trebonia sp.]